jgi:ribose 1,5-bisphosphokinase PhnN
VRERLLARGRETGAELEARIRRSQDLSAARLPGDMELINGSGLDTSGRELLALLAGRSLAGTP